MKNVPNIISFSRLILLPIVCYYILNSDEQTNFILCVSLFALLGALDKLDGIAARSFNQETEFGALIDPIIDKICFHTVCILLLLQNSISIWPVLIFLYRDFIVTQYRNNGHISSKAKKLGKLKHRFQLFYVLTCCFNLSPEIRNFIPFFNTLNYALLFLSVTFSLWSLLTYTKTVSLAKD